MTHTNTFVSYLICESAQSKRCLILQDIFLDYMYIV